MTLRWSRNKQEKVVRYLIWDLLCHAPVGISVCVCVFFKSRHRRQTVTFTASYPSKQPAWISLYDDAGWPVCAAVNSGSLKQFWRAACSLTEGLVLELWAGVRRGRARLHSVNKASTSSSVCPWRSLTSKHQSKTGADIICHQGFPAGEL